MSESATVTAEQIEIPTLSLDNVIDSYTQVENGKPREDIVQMLEWYSWTPPTELYPDDLNKIINYCDFKPGSETDILSKHGSDRSIVAMARNYEELQQSLEVEAKEKIESIIQSLAKGETMPPCFILDKPLEFYNGQVIDGVHRIIAAGVAYQRGITFKPLTAFVGHDKNPLKTKIRYQQNRLKSFFKK